MDRARKSKFICTETNETDETNESNELSEHIEDIAIMKLCCYYAGTIANCATSDNICSQSGNYCQTDIKHRRNKWHGQSHTLLKS